MTKYKARLLASVSMVALLTVPAMASSSGSFAGVSFDHNCVINSGTGVLSSTSGGNTATSFPITAGTINFKVSAGAGTTLVITPSAVVGLYTDNKITKTSSSSIADEGVQVEVIVKPPAGVAIGTASGDLQIAPSLPKVCSSTTAAESCVTYDQRFIEIKSNTLQKLAATTGNQTAFELIESTLSAHAFNFYTNVPVTGTYDVTVKANLFVNHTVGPATVAACFGPATVTVEQAKNFSFNGAQLNF